MKTSYKITFLVAAFLLIAVSVVPSIAQDGSSWSKRCSDVNGEERCEIFQQIVVKETGARVAEFALGFPNGKKSTASGVIVVPLGILLEEGATMQVDDNRPFSFRIRYCLKNGCFAFVDMDKKILKTLKKGKGATITVLNAGGQKISIPVSLIGLTKALKEIS